MHSLRNSPLINNDDLPIAVEIKDNEVSIAWEPAQRGKLQVQQVLVSADHGNTWKYNAISDQGPMLSPHVGSLNGERCAHVVSPLRGELRSDKVEPISVCSVCVCAQFHS
jgi:hypothetical protein